MPVPRHSSAGWIGCAESSTAACYVKRLAYQTWLLRALPEDTDSAACAPAAQIADARVVCMSQAPKLIFKSRRAP